MRSAAKRQALATLALIIVVGSGLGLAWLHQRALPKRFGVVEAGRLYRCGEVSPRQMEHVTRKYGLRTVLSLLNPDAPESIVERAAAQRLGLRWVNVPLPGNGASTPEDRHRIKAVLLDPTAGPLLVHCAAGTNRTGLAVGLYRLYQHRWTVAQVLEEMRQYGFDDLPRHENLRQALSAEWEAAQADQPASTQPVQP